MNRDAMAECLCNSVGAVDSINNKIHEVTSLVLSNKTQIVNQIGERLNHQNMP